MTCSGMNLRALTLCAGWLCGLVAGRPAAAGRIERPVVTVSNPPPVRMLVPGFTVRELPLVVNNINNLVFAPDGRLFALCYDGNVLQLKDSDGDGLEDAFTYFYRNDRNEILPSIGMCWGPGGLYIASQGRVIRLRDQGDGTAELETVTGGWVPMSSAAGANLDAVGIAVDQAGAVYFGLGCDAWNRPYRVDAKTGKSEYNLHSERGTVIKLSPDWKRRESLCTGLRFTVSLAFNAAGDLFATDQEGATWLPNGNPFDELLHIQPGRHYGFPPRHPKYLPDVIDEPSTFDYAPQHESTCGLHFNDGKIVFGPEWWRGDAIVAGESRGKIWRTKLVKSAAGYVAKTDLIARLSMLTLDAVPTPQGDLLVCCHSGQPDWGTGPQGQGRLFKISYTDQSAPQPVLAYAPSPTESEVVFDRPLGLKQVLEFPGQYSVAMGKYVTAGERFESFQPGYQVVKNQRTMPRFELPVTAVTAGARSLRLRTDARSEAVNYALTLGGAIAGDNQELDVLSDLTGVSVEWQAARGGENWSGWLPHLDLRVARGLAQASGPHQELFDAWRQRGTLILRGQLDLFSMLHPAVQPESKLDFEYPAEHVTLVLEADVPLTLRMGTNLVSTGRDQARVMLEPRENRWLPLEVVMATGGGEPRLDVSWFTAEDPRPRPLPLRRVLLPWARPYLAVATTTHPPELENASWQRGRELFFGDQAGCYKCHTIRGEGGKIGADLSNLIYRDYASVLKDITEPSAAINPDHIAYNVQLKDGDVETGVLLENNPEEIVLGQVTGKSLRVPRSKIANLKSSAISLMPEGLLKGLTEAQQHDLMRFLLTVQ